MQTILNPTLPKLAAIGKAIPGLIITLLFVCILLHEWFIIGVFANPADIAQYPFGSEEAMSDGGWYYLNASLYARAMLTYSVIFLAPLLAFGSAIIKRTNTSIITAYGLLAFAWLTMYMLGHYHIA